jgi:ribosomal protein L40E
MAEIFDVSLYTQEIRYIGAHMADKKGGLFPFLTGEEKADISGEGIERLKKAGVLTASGSLTKKAENAFRSLAGADAYASIGYNGARIAINIVVYFSKEGRTFIVPEGEMVRIAHPADPAAIGEILTEIIGTSVIRSLDVDVTLPNSAALCLAAAVDLVRRSLMGSILDRHRYERSVMPKIAIADWLSQDNPSPQWLATRLKTYLGIRGQVSQADVSEGLDALVKAKLFQPKGDAFFPSEDIERIAERFLVIDTLIFAKGGRLADKKTISTAQFEVVQSGFSDLLLWEAGAGGTVHILSVSPKLLVSMLTDLISNREALKGMPTEAVPETKSGAAVCEKCGASLAPDAEFCSKCGTPTGEEKKPEERTCAGCGRKLPADAKFCDGCGKAVE